MIDILNFKLSRVLVRIDTVNVKIRYSTNQHWNCEDSVDTLKAQDKNLKGQNWYKKA